MLDNIRDPRLDPKLGDVLRKGGKNETVVVEPWCEAALNDWREWAKDAEVIDTVSTPHGNCHYSGQPPVSLPERIKGVEDAAREAK